MAVMQDHPSIVLANRQVADGLHVMTLRAPRLAPLIEPGQFVHMDVPTLASHILRRPFSVYDVDEEAGTVDILYQVVGVGTADMSKWQPGYLTSMIGPIGHGWSVPEGTARALLVGGGVGAAPLLLLYRSLVSSDIETDVILGAATSEALVCKDRFAEVGDCLPACSTDDGSYGRAGFCTLLVDEALEAAEGEGRPYDYVAACGPEPLMRAVADRTAASEAVTEVSLERRMACGIGACLSCVVDTTQGRKRACVDGPVFDADVVLWPSVRH